MHRIIEALFGRKQAVCVMVMAILISLPVGVRASAIDEGTHHLSNVDIHYIEAMPNGNEGDALQDRMRRIYKQLDLAKVPPSKAEQKQADDLAIENGLLDIPHPLYDALIQELAYYEVNAYPTFYSSIRSTDQTEKVRKQLAGKYHERHMDADYVLSLLPYRATLKDKQHSVVWIGVWLQNRRTNSSSVHYLKVPFDGDHHHGFDRTDGERIASTLVTWMVEQGLISKKQ